jgi:SAM-dependent methyltransferase
MGSAPRTGERQKNVSRNGLLARFYPESRFGGFSDIDGTVAFYQRVNVLLEPGFVVVDFGCGPGDYGNDAVRLRLGLRSLRGKVRKVIGLDVDPRGAGNPFVEEFRLIADGQRWPVESGAADMVLCDNVIEHLERPEWFFAEAQRVLRPGGYLAIRTPNVLSYVGLASRFIPNHWHMRVLRTVQPGRLGAYPTVYRCNTVWRLRRMLAEYGFDGVAYGYEAEPSYLNFSKVAYAAGVLHQKLAPGFVRPAIFAFARRNRVPATAAPPCATG